MLPPKTFGRPTAASRWLIRLDVVLLPLLPVTPTVRSAWSAIHSALPPVTGDAAGRAARPSTGGSAARPASGPPRRRRPARRTRGHRRPAAPAAASSPSQGTDRKFALSSTAISRDGPCAAMAVTAARPSRPVPQTATDVRAGLPGAQSSSLVSSRTSMARRSYDGSARVRTQFEVMRFPSYAFDPATGVATFDYLLDGPAPAGLHRDDRVPGRPVRARRTPSTGCWTCCTSSPG